MVRLTLQSTSFSILTFLTREFRRTHPVLQNRIASCVKSAFEKSFTITLSRWECCRSYDIYLTDVERSRLESLVPALKHGGRPGKRYQPGGYYLSIVRELPSLPDLLRCRRQEFASIRSGSSYFKILGLPEEGSSTTSPRPTRRTTTRGQDA